MSKSINLKLKTKKNQKRIYLDNAATTQISKEVVDSMKPYLNEIFGNSSSLHSFGREAEEALENARKIISHSINAEKKDIIFTSGGTEGNNFVIKGIAFANKTKGNHLITTKIEHDSVLNTFNFLKRFGFRVSFLDVDNEGFIDLNQLKKTITKKTILVSVIHGNNEVGTIQDIGKIGRICRKNKVLFHTDACQSYLKTKIDVKKQNIDLMTLNAHKIHGPKGIGAVYLRGGIKIYPLLNGGEQEFQLRSGTSNIPAIVGFAKAVEIFRKKDIKKIRKIQKKLFLGIKTNITGAELNGAKTDENRLPHILNFSFCGVEGESVLYSLDSKGIAVSTGSACSSHSLKPSHVLTSMGLTSEQSHNSVRFSLSKYNSNEEIDKTISILKKSVERLRKISPIYKNEEESLKK